jgi:hypothetical protein
MGVHTGRYGFLGTVRHLIKSREQQQNRRWKIVGPLKGK